MANDGRRPSVDEQLGRVSEGSCLVDAVAVHILEASFLVDGFAEDAVPCWAVHSEESHLLSSRVIGKFGMMPLHFLLRRPPGMLARQVLHAASSRCPAGTQCDWLFVFLKSY